MLAASAPPVVLVSGGLRLASNLHAHEQLRTERTRERGVFFGFARSLQAFCVLVGQKRAPYDNVMAILVNTGPLLASP